MYRPRTSPKRLGAAALTIVLITTACGSSTPTTGPSGQPSTQPSAQPGTQQPGQSAGPTQTAEPSPTAEPGQETPPGTTAAPATDGPLPTFEPEAPPEPLQEPELHTPDEIAEALFRPELAEQAVVSMLNELGIGIYNVDGSPIRVGSEASDADFYLFEPEVRGLIDMLQEQDEPEKWITFGDFHAALTGLGFQGSADDLAAAYSDAYAEAPDDPIVKFVNATAAYDPEGSFPFSRAGAWLLLLDGFVPPHGASENAAVRGAGGGLAQSSSPPSFSRWGRARDRIRERNPFNVPPMNVDPALVARIMTIVGHFSITVRANPPQVHEGHGGSGSPSIIVAQVRAAAGAFVSPFTGTSIVPVNQNPVDGLNVTWHLDDALNRHGSATPLTDATGVIGAVRTAYTPIQERANGQGANISETGTITATVPAADLVNALYNLPTLGALASGVASGTAPLVVQWHDEIMHVELTNRYDVTITTFVGDTHGDGTDRFVGDLARVADGKWVGTLEAEARGSWRGAAFGSGCSTSWNARQQIFVVGTEDPNLPNGNFIFQFYPGGSPPSGSLGRGRCPPTVIKRNGEPYAPFNDSRITTPDEGGGLIVTLPAKPGGTTTYPVASPGGGITIRNTSWVVKITFPTPP